MADLNGDGSPEIGVRDLRRIGPVRLAGGLGANQRQSLSGGICADQRRRRGLEGYMGHDSFAVSGNTLVRHFPLYKAGDRNAQPTGVRARSATGWTSAEAGWVLRRERISDGPVRANSTE
ncbi:MAG: hypothetical protein IPP21_15735 [Betaproteobacteria bacterium]|nr:hypothetical protein [Betaproteobacteria bacterium]